MVTVAPSLAQAQATPEPSSSTLTPLPAAPGLAATAPPAAAPPPVRETPSAGSESDLDKPATYRSGVVFGLGLGVGTVDVSGYPNSASRLDDPAYYHSSGPILGLASRLFLMGALADTFNFGVWFGGMSGQNDTTKVLANGGGFRLEAFPLFSVHPRLRDLGFVAQVGLGGAVADKKDKSLSVDGIQSFLGAGFVYELSRAKFIGLRVVPGLMAEYQYVTSPSIDSHGALFGARVAFYGGP